MCVIVDSNAAHQIFTDKPSDAGKELFSWISKGKARLVTGGRHLYELRGSGKEARILISQTIQSGVARRLCPHRVTEREKKVQQEFQLKSDDPHIIALAQLSGARLLFSNDRDLHLDFRDSRLIHSPYGHIYTTVDDKERRFTQEHANLLERENLCGGVCI